MASRDPHAVKTQKKRKSNVEDDRPAKHSKPSTADGSSTAGNVTKFGAIPAYAQRPAQQQTQRPELPPVKEGDLLNAVFTHSSVTDGKYSRKSQSTYEQLEFYGDAAIEFISTRLIFHNFPTLLTGRQSILRQTLVNNKTLAGFSRWYGFPDRVRTTVALRNSPQWEKTCADVFEAYVAAVVLGSPDGFKVAEDWLTQLWTPLLPKEQSKRTGIDTNYKDELQRKIGGYQIVLKYEKVNDPVLDAAAARGGQQMKMRVWLTGWGHEMTELGRGVGIGKIEAGMFAAKDALERQDGVLEDIVEKKRLHDERRRAEKEAAANEATAAAAAAAAAA